MCDVCRATVIYYVLVTVAGLSAGTYLTAQVTRGAERTERGAKVIR